LGGRDPGERGAGDGFRGSGGDVAAEEAEVDPAIGVGMDNFVQEGADANFYVEFLLEFALEGLGEGLAGLTLAAGEFPKTSEGVVGVALGDEQAVVMEEDARGDWDG
jgi:hypothetical protein